MNVELKSGDLFVVKRGFPLRSESLWGMSSGPQTYDRSHDGVVYRAISVVDDSVAAEIVFYDRTWGNEKVGKRSLINATELLLTVVPQSHVEFLEACAVEDEAE